MWAVNWPAADVAALDAILNREPERPPTEAPNAAPSQGARRARITWASEIEPIPVVWAWSEGGAGRIPAGSLSVAAGREGTGKSSWALWLAAHMTRGTLPGTFYGTPQRVLYVAVEDSWAHTLVPRLIAAGADLSMVGRFDVVVARDEETTLSLPVDNDLLEQAVKLHRVAGVFIDPLMSVMGAGIDTHKERDVRQALDPLAKLADRTGALVIGIAHFGKSNSSDAASLITGSGAFKNVPRAVFGFAKDDADEAGGRVMTQVKNSLGRDDLPSLTYVIEPHEVYIAGQPQSIGRFAFTGTSDRSVEDIIRDSRSIAADEDDQSARTGAEHWLTDFLSSEGGQAARKDVMKAARGEFSDRTLQRVMRNTARFHIKSSGYPRTTTWCLTVETDSGDTPGETPYLGATVATDATETQLLPQQQHDKTVSQQHGETDNSWQSRLSRHGFEAPRDPVATVAPTPTTKACGHPGKALASGKCGTCIADQLAGNAA